MGAANALCDSGAQRRRLEAYVLLGGAWFVGKAFHRSDFADCVLHLARHFKVEDLFYIDQDGKLVMLTKGLPRTADEVEAAMRKQGGRSSA